MKAILVGILLILSCVHAEENIVAEEPNFTIDDLLETLRGIFEAWEVNKEEVHKLLLCVSGLKDIELQIAKIMEEIKKIDLKDIVKLVEAIVRLFGAVQQLFKDITPCIDSKGEIIIIVKKLIKLTPIEMLLKIFHNIMNEGKKIYNDIISMIDAFKTKNYYKFGYYMGDILELLFLKDPDR